MYENKEDHAIFDVYNVYRLSCLIYDNIKVHMFLIICIGLVFNCMIIWRAGLVYTLQWV